MSDGPACRRFEVSLEVTDVYRCTVEAENEEVALALARDLSGQSDDSLQYHFTKKIEGSARALP